MDSWYDNPEMVGRLPLAYRFVAQYWRLAFSRKPPLRGGSFLLRIASRISRVCHLRDRAELKVKGITIHVDLLDSRFPFVVVEASGHTPEARIISESLALGDTFVDVGANHGAYSVFAAQLVGEQGKVLAFEPQPRLAGLLRASLDENNACRWEVHELACGAEPSHAEFYSPSSGSGTAGLFQAFSAQGEHTTHRVQIAPLDDVVNADALPGNIFIKVDIEGSELQFLRGAGKLICSRRPTILIELNPDAASCAGHSTNAVLDELESLGYMTFSTPFAYPERMRRCDINTKKQQNVLAWP